MTIYDNDNLRNPGGGIVINCHFLKSVLLHVLDDAEYFWKKLFFDLKKISKFFEPLSN